MQYVAKRCLIFVTGLFLINIFHSCGEAGSPLFEINDPGTEDIIDYKKYGEFQKVGTPDYQYKIL